ncbi:MAG: TIR domain-containing protein [Verrucomicrobiales bacterium]|nr:TIR domain-containing protein [Verrucomicrobiales bacterium]
MPTVFVAESSPAVEECRSRLISELNGLGVEIISVNESYRLDPNEAVEQTRNLMGSLDMSIHLFGSDPGRLTVPSQQGERFLPEIQFDLAQQSSSEALPVYSFSNFLPKARLETPITHENQAERSYSDLLLSLSTQRRPAKVFYSYCHADGTEAVRELRRHLAAKARHGILTHWWDHAIPAGDNWDHRIQSELVGSDIVICLITSGWMASEYAQEKEYQVARALGKKVIPILVTNYDLSREEIDTQAILPRDDHGKLLPVSQWPHPDNAWQAISKSIGDAAIEIQNHSNWKVDYLKHTEGPVDQGKFDDFIQSIKKRLNLQNQSISPPSASRVHRRIAGPEPLHSPVMIEDSYSARTHNPYPGLRPYRSDESHLFCGREEEVEDLVDRLTAFRFLAILGASGCGKSSLIHAGLIPRLKAGKSIHTEWTIIRMRPGNEPINSLAKEFESALNLKGQYHTIHDKLNKKSTGIVDILEAIDWKQEDHLFILIDQFEELFTFDVPLDIASRFVELLINAAWSRSFENVHVAITMRSDQNLGKCSKFEKLPEAINSGMYLVPHMDRAQLERAICAPLGDQDLITPALVNRLVNSVNSLNDDTSRDALPVLQHTLMRIWQNWEANGSRGPLDIDHLESVGETAGALSQHIELVMDSLNSDEARDAARQLFLDLSEIDKNGMANRRPKTFRQLHQLHQHRSELSQSGALDENALRRMIDQFRADGRSFLLPSHFDIAELTDDTVIDLPHESLIRQWEWLREKTGDRQREIENWQVVERNSEFWEAEGRRPEDLNLSEGQTERFEAIRKNYPEIEKTKNAEWFLDENIAKNRQLRKQREDAKEKTTKTRYRKRIKYISYAAVVIVLGLLAVIFNMNRLHANSEVGKLEADVRKTAAELSTAKTEITKKEQELEAARANLKLAQENIDTNQSEIETLTNQINIANTEISILKSKIPDTALTPTGPDENVLREAFQVLIENRNEFFLTAERNAPSVLNGTIRNQEATQEHLSKLSDFWQSAEWLILDEPSFAFSDSEQTGQVDALLAFSLKANGEHQIGFTQHQSKWDLTGEAPELIQLTSNYLDIEAAMRALIKARDTLESALSPAYVSDRLKNASSLDLSLGKKASLVTILLFHVAADSRNADQGFDRSVLSVEAKEGDRSFDEKNPFRRFIPFGLPEFVDSPIPDQFKVDYEFVVQLADTPNGSSPKSDKIATRYILSADRNYRQLKSDPDFDKKITYKYTGFIPDFPSNPWTIPVKREAVKPTPQQPDRPERRGPFKGLFNRK